MFGFVFGIVFLFAGVGLAASQTDMAGDSQILGVILVVIGVSLMWLFRKSGAAHWKLSIALVLVVTALSLGVLWSVAGSIGIPV